MFTPFVGISNSWRAFLVGPRRSWHPHHYLSILGHRGGRLVVRPSTQFTQLSRAIQLLTAVIARGGSVWGFGVTPFNGPLLTQWGAAWAEWLPGQITNGLYQRLGGRAFLRYNRLDSRQAHQGRTLRTSLRRGLASFQRRWQAFDFNCYSHGRTTTPLVIASVLMSNLDGRPGGPALSRLVRLGDQIAADGWGSAGWARRAPGWSATNKHAVRAWVGGTAYRRVQQRGRPPVWAARLGLAPPFRAVCHHQHHQRRSDLQQVHPDRWRFGRTNAVTAPRWSRQSQAQPLRFPALLVGIGRLYRMGLVNESNNLALPIVYFVGSSFRPWVTPFAVLWNTAGRAGEGVGSLLLQAYRKSWSAGFFQAVWSRLV